MPIDFAIGRNQILLAGAQNNFIVAKPSGKCRFVELIKFVGAFVNALPVARIAALIGANRKDLLAKRSAANFPSAGAAFRQAFPLVFVLNLGA